MERDGNQVLITENEGWEEIAQETGVPVDSLKNRNPLLAKKGLEDGDIVDIPTASEVAHWVPLVPEISFEPEEAEPEPEPQLQRFSSAPEPYMVRTEDDLLRWVWVHGAKRRLEDYDKSKAEALLRTLSQDAVYNAYQSIVTHAQTNLNYASGNVGIDHLVSRLFDYSDNVDYQQAYTEYLSTLTTDQLLAIYNQIAPVADKDTFFPGEIPYDEVIAAYNALQIMEQGGQLADDPYASFQPDLAMSDFYSQRFQERDPEAVERKLFAMAVEMIAWRGGDASMLGSGEYRTFDQIVEGIHAYLGENATIDDLMGLIEQIATEPEAFGDIVSQISEMPDPVMLPEYRDYALDMVAEYHDAAALDQLRKIVYDPNWNPDEDERLLGELQTAISAMPAAILEVDVTFARDGFQAYLDAVRQFHDWRLRLKAEMDLIEADMLARQGEGQSPLWWMTEAVLSVLVEPLDWVFTIYHVLQGDPLALIGLIPLVPSALHHIAGAGRLMRGASDELLQAIRRVDEVLPQADTVERLLGDTDALYMKGPINPLGNELPVQFKTLSGPFESLEDAKKWMGDTYPYLDFDPTGANVLAISQAIDQYHYLSQRWPTVSRRIRAIVTDKSPPGLAVSLLNDAIKDNPDIAAVVLAKRYIGLNTNIDLGAFGSLEYAHETFRLGQWLVGNNARGSITHEFAHLVAVVLGEQSTKIKKQLDSWLSENVASIELSQYPLSVDLEDRGIESLAEGFVALNHTPKELWTDYVRELHSFLIKLVGDDKWSSP